ncbi:unnamed protein product, partial [Symbiodinium necroappetens]
MAAVSLLSSTAAFEKQCEKVGLAASWVDAMKSTGITTLGKLSYAVSLPGTQPTTDDMESFTTALRPGAPITLGDASAIKQLIFEAQTMTVAELRSTMQSSDEASRKLPASERSMRIEAQKRRLQGLPLEGPLSVAHCVYDKLANMRENDELKYLSPGECITRDAELCNEKPPKDPPPEFQRVSRAQVLRADRQCFLELARICNGSLKPDASGVLPLDREFDTMEQNLSVMYFLLPVKGKGKGKSTDKGNPRKRTTEANGDGKGKKAKITRDPIPEALKGMHSRTPDNKPICFNYNLGKCKAGAKCKFKH